MTRLVLFELFELFVTSLLLFEHNKKLLVSWQFSGPYGVTKYGSGWRKDVVNQCLECGWWTEHYRGDKVEGLLTVNNLVHFGLIKVCENNIKKKKIVHFMIFFPHWSVKFFYPETLMSFNIKINKYIYIYFIYFLKRKIKQ